jgi:hypothetical protein
MPQYMLLINAPRDARPDPEMAPAWFQYTQDLEAAGVKVAGDALQPGDTATTVCVRGGETVISDGPFAETKELIAGYYILDVPDLDAALAWAAKMPAIDTNVVEVRPVMVFQPSAA